MPLEIEKKYLVDLLKWEDLKKPAGILYRQGYLVAQENKSVRIRASDTEAFITIKGKTEGASRSEFEYAIPLPDALNMLDTLCETEISKTRYEIIYRDKKWEVDIFHGRNEGLMVAEIELSDENQKFDLPEWVSKEVTDDPRYYNTNLALNPFRNWQVSS